MIRVEEIRKSYGSRPAVDGVSFALRRGETFGLLGPNGAGKTTTIHLLAGLLKPDSGRIVLDGIAGDMRRSLGLAPQTLSLYPDLTGEENVHFFGRLYGMAGGPLRRRAAEVLEMAGLTGRHRERVEVYSGGMQRRLNLACAMVHDPPFLLLDEPTAGVDPQSRNHLFESIEALKRTGKTVLYTTHYMEEAERLCDRVAILDGGKILATDTVERLRVAHGGRSVIEGERETDASGGAVAPFRLDTDRPFEDLARLTREGMRFRQVRIRQPDLESVFLNLTGRRLRDEP
jgi:ABC-2 type transport system ATP-binding protein